MKKPHNYYCHRTHPQTESIPEGYEVIDKIGEGAFGEVFKVFNVETSSIQVIKKTKDAENSNALLYREGEIMSEMENSDGFARVKHKDKDNGCLIMTFLGQNLQDVIDKSPISLIDMKRIAYQCIQRLKELHDRGYVHRDLKPENILMGNQNNPHKIYLVDFGLSSNFKKTATAARKVYNG
jgi:serine/threonine protein kinase